MGLPVRVEWFGVSEDLRKRDALKLVFHLLKATGCAFLGVGK